MEYLVLILAVISSFRPSSPQDLGDSVSAALDTVKSWETFRTRSSSEVLIKAAESPLEITKRSQEDVQYWKADDVNYELFASLTRERLLKNNSLMSTTRLALDITQGVDFWVKVKEAPQGIALRLPEIYQRWGKPADSEKYWRIPRGKECLDEIDLGIGEVISPDILATAVKESDTIIEGMVAKRVKVDLPCKDSPLNVHRSDAVMNGPLEEPLVDLQVKDVGLCRHTMTLSFGDAGIVQIRRQYYLSEFVDVYETKYRITETATRTYWGINGTLNFDKEPTHYYPKRFPRQKKAGSSHHLIIVICAVVGTVLAISAAVGIITSAKMKKSKRTQRDQEEPLIPDDTAVSGPQDE